jgi:hypothetical protein
MDLRDCTQVTGRDVFENRGSPFFYKLWTINFDGYQSVKMAIMRTLNLEHTAMLELFLEGSADSDPALIQLATKHALRSGLKPMIMLLHLRYGSQADILE